MTSMLEIPGFVAELLADIPKPSTLMQFGVAAVCLGFAWAMVRLVKGQFGREGTWHAGANGIRRLLFPFVALILILAARSSLAHYQSVALLSFAVPLLVALGGIRIATFMLQYIFPHNSLVKRSERYIGLIIWLVFALHITGLLPDVLGALDDLDFNLGKHRISALLVLSGLLSVVATVLVSMWLGSLLESRIMQAASLDMSLRVVATKTVRALLLILGILVALDFAGIDLTMLSVFGGALGVGLGLGLQKIASNYISGFIILLDRSIRIGDLIEVDSRRGTVTSITSRYTVLKALTGTEAIIPNDTLISGVVNNLSYTAKEMWVSVPVQISYDSDLPAAMEVLRCTAIDMPRVLADPAPGVFVVAFADSGINLELGFWVGDPENGLGGIKSQIYLRIWKAFKEEGIDIPYPRRELTLLNADELGAARSVQSSGANGEISIESKPV